MEFQNLKDEEVDESFEPVWTVQGILRFPRMDVKRGPDGKVPARRYLVPDSDRWCDVPGFPAFLWDATQLSAGAVRPLTAEERRAHLRGKIEEAAEPREMELTVVAETQSIRINGKSVGLSPREVELLSRTIEESPLSHNRALRFLEGLGSKSPGAIKGFVEKDALHDHRKSILAKVEREAGRQARVVLGEAFTSKSGTLVYDASLLPVRREEAGGG